MRKIGSVLTKITPQIRQIMLVRQNWKEIVGEILSMHTEPVLIKKKVLHVICDSPAWAQQINMLSKTIEKQIKDIINIKITSIEGKFGMVRKILPSAKTNQNLGRFDIDNKDIEKLKDPELAVLIKSLIQIGSDNND